MSDADPRTPTPTTAEELRQIKVDKCMALDRTAVLDSLEVSVKEREAGVQQKEGELAGRLADVAEREMAVSVQESYLQQAKADVEAMLDSAQTQKGQLGGQLEALEARSATLAAKVGRGGWAWSRAGACRLGAGAGKQAGGGGAGAGA